MRLVNINFCKYMNSNNLIPNPQLETTAGNGFGGGFFIRYADAVGLRYIR